MNRQTVNSLLELEEYLLEHGKKANKNKLFHFTTYESLVKILSGKSFLLSRLGTSNDKAESRLFHDGEASTNFIMCLREDDTEDISMWAMYGKRSGIKIRLEFSKKELLKILNNHATTILLPNKHGLDMINNNKFEKAMGLVVEDKIESLWYPKGIKPEPYFPASSNDNLKYKLGPVAYLNKKEHTFWVNGKYLRDSNNNLYKSTEADIKNNTVITGLVKYDVWRAEKEIRLILKYDNSKEDYIMLPITDELIKTFEVTFNPWLDDDLKIQIQKSLSSLCNYPIKCKSSNNNKEVSEDIIMR